jgi:A/G-specific adenine glycosylase
MIETNIRAVYLHFYFKDQESISDAQLLPVVERTISLDRPREWFYALMDYGVLLKRHVPGINKRSRHYARQGPYHGSLRQARASVLKLVTRSGTISKRAIAAALAAEGLTVDSERLDRVLGDLCSEGFMVCERSVYSVP